METICGLEIDLFMCGGNALWGLSTKTDTEGTSMHKLALLFVL